jgi:ferrochelatase
LERLAKSGVKRLLVLSPAFVADCLETIEELGIRGKESFIKAGGENFQLVPCLNEHPAWIAALENMAKRFLKT